MSRDASKAPPVCACDGCGAWCWADKLVQLEAQATGRAVAAPYREAPRC